MSDRVKQVQRWANMMVSHDWREQVWDADAVLPDFAKLTAEMSAHPGGKVLAQRALNNEGFEVLWICHEFADGTYGYGFNISFPCPPRCS
jgi:hypothetical protein